MDTEAPAEQAEHAARRSGALKVAVRCGLVGYGLLHLLVAWVSVSLAFGAGGRATGRGALAQLADGGVGRVTLGAMSLGFTALVLWQLAAGLVGYRDRDGKTRHLMRAGALGRVIAYAYLAVASGGLAFDGASAGGGSPDSTTAKVMALPAGPWLVAAVGATAGCIGIVLVVFGWRGEFIEQLDEKARTRDRRLPIVLLGYVGYVAKGSAFVVVGVLLGWAAWSHDPKESGGLDEALYELLGGVLGTLAVVVIGVGIGCFGLFLIARARHLNHNTLTR